MRCRYTDAELIKADGEKSDLVSLKPEQDTSVLILIPVQRQLCNCADEIRTAALLHACRKWIGIPLGVQINNSIEGCTSDIECEYPDESGLSSNPLFAVINGEYNSSIGRP